MHIVLDKKVCQNFNLSIEREWLETNNLGSYSSSTIYGLNNRIYHGLYAIPIGSVNERTIILSKFEESVFIGTHAYDLSTNRFFGGVHPHGYRYLVEFRIDPFPRFTFMIANRRIEKTVFLLHDQNILVIRYANKNQGVPIKLIVKPLIAGRKTTELGKEIPDIITDSYSDGKVVRIAPKPEIPELNIYYLKGEYFQAPLWYYNFKYEMGSESRGKNKSILSEDQFNPGFFTCTLNAYETFDMFISVHAITNFDYEGIYHSEKEYRRKIGSKFKIFPAFAKDIYESIKTFRISRSEKYPLLLPNYHHYQMTTREMILALPGLTMVERNINSIKRVITYFEHNLNDGLFPEKYPFDDKEKQDYAADLSLLFINFAYHFIEFTNDIDYLDQVLLDLCKSIVDGFNKGTRHEIFKDKDDLLSTGSKEIVTSWIPLRDAKNNVLRYGKLLEMNALWYNALKIMESFCQLLDKIRQAKRYAKLAKRTQESFLAYFYDQSRERFYDLIRYDWQDTSFRINQLFLIALPFSMLSQEQGAKLLQEIDDELLTPFGLRSLSAKEKPFKGRLKVNISSQDPEYYLGCVWPWTIGLYADAVLKIMGQNPTIITYIKKVLQNFKKLYYHDGMGYISEIYEGSKPHRKNATLAYSLNLTEIFRVYNNLKSKSV